MTDLQTTGALILNGTPVTCPACGMSAAFDLDRRGLRETWPAWIVCRDCGHGQDHPVITNGLIEAAVAARTGRATRYDSDLFAAQWRDLTLIGECVPEFVLDDAVALGEELAQIGKQEIRARKTGARRWWRSRKRNAGRAVRRSARQAAGAVTATALATAWDLQTGGAGPQPKPRQKCRTKGCRGGWVTITTRIYGDTGRAEQVQQPCAICHRT